MGRRLLRFGDKPGTRYSPPVGRPEGVAGRGMGQQAPCHPHATNDPPASANSHGMPVDTEPRRHVSRVDTQARRHVDHVDTQARRHAPCRHEVRMGVRGLECEGRSARAWSGALPPARCPLAKCLGGERPRHSARAHVAGREAPFTCLQDTLEQ